MLRIDRPVYGLVNGQVLVPEGQKGMMIAKLPPMIIGQGMFGNNAIVEFMLDKFAYYMPYYRQHQKYLNLGVDLKKTTLEGCFKPVAELLKPLAEELSKAILNETGYVQCDGTTIPVVNKEKHKACKEYIWTLRAPLLHLVRYNYLYEGSRGGKVGEELLGNYKDYLQTDDYEVYRSLCGEGKACHAGCLAHLRRYIEKAKDENAKVSNNGLYIIQQFVAGQSYIIDYNVYETLNSKPETTGAKLYPIFPAMAMPLIASIKADVKFLTLQFGTPAEEYIACLKAHPEVVVICVSNHQNRLGDQRALVHEMMNAGLKNPVVFAEMYQHGKEEKSDFQLEAAADMGALMIDGLTDGIWLMNNGDIPAQTIDETAFGILQAARLRTSKTEYISCPGCGRTLYDLRETIAKIKEATKHLKGLKIGIMGCIVNGPGEMADADYGYVGAGPNRVSLYRKQVCVEKNIPQEVAVEHLLALIDSDKQ